MDRINNNVGYNIFLDAMPYYKLNTELRSSQ